MSDKIRTDGDHLGEAADENIERSVQERLKTLEGVARKNEDTNLRETKKKQADAGNPYPHKLRD